MALRRREWLKTFAGASVGALGLPLVNGANAQATASAQTKPDGPPLALKDYQPKSMLHVPETHVPRSGFRISTSTLIFRGWIGKESPTS